ncbi:SLATT domain-containing protein [Enterococcus hirae]|nr:SLATT domain-containing protein [Enterococcus hirae]
MSKQQNKIHEELKNFIVNVGWTHKIHIVRSDEYSGYSNAFKTVRIIIAALTSSGLIGILFIEGSYILSLATAILSFATVAMNSLDKAVDYDKLSLKEKTDANNFWELRIEAESLLHDTVYNTKNMSEIEEKLIELKRLRKQYNDGLLNVPNRTVNKACKLVNERKDNDYSNDYIKFIAPELLDLKVEDDSADVE